MVFLKRGSKTYKCRITAAGGASAELSTGCHTKADAVEVEQAVRRWEGKREKKHARPALVNALVERRVSLADAFEASLDGTLDRVVSEALEAPAVVKTVNLSERVHEWHDWKRAQKRGAKSADDYLRQLGTLFPEVHERRLTLALFTRAEVATRLDRLAVQAPTKNRYKLAASGFAKFLVRRGVLETNFVRDIEGFGENDPRMVYYERPEAQRLIFGLHDPVAGVAAFMAGFCMEWGAIAALLARDVSLVVGDERVYVRGTKTKNRLRTVPLVEENRWLLPVLERAVAHKAPNALVFAGLEKWVALKQQRKVAKDLTVVAVGETETRKHSLHDWRHTHTVQLLRDGYDEAVAAWHLGHADTRLLRTCYGAFIVTQADYTRRRVVKEESATTSSTTTLDRVERRGPK
jgi:integrase